MADDNHIHNYFRLDIAENIYIWNALFLKIDRKTSCQLAVPPLPVCHCSLLSAPCIFTARCT